MFVYFWQVLLSLLLKPVLSKILSYMQVMQRAFGSLSSRWVQLQRLSTGISGKIQAADIVGYRGRRIRVAASSASLPGKLYIMETEGDATWKTDKGVFKVKMCLPNPSSLYHV